MAANLTDLLKCLRAALVTLNVASDRVYTEMAPQGARTFPRLILTLISDDEDVAHDGSGLPSWRIQISIHAETVAGCVLARDSIHAALHGFSGTLTAGAVTCDVGFCEVTNAYTTFEDELEIFILPLELEITLNQ